MKRADSPDMSVSVGAGHWRRIILGQLRANQGRIVFGRLSTWEAGMLREMEDEGIIERMASDRTHVVVRLKPVEATGQGAPA